MTDSTTTMIIGTCVFAALWLISAIIIHFKATSDVSDSRLKGEYRCMAFSLTFLGAFCMWLMWICVYMHQMHPLINPIMKVEK